MLAVEGLVRTYGEVKALDGMTFAVPPGSVTGFLGPNGAGKTTTMRAIFGLTALKRGMVTMDGRPVDRPARRRFGYLPEERGLYPTMRVIEQLCYLGELRGMSRAEVHGEAERWLEELGLSERAGDPLEDLSLGNQQRVQLISALIHRPDVLVLDEPFSGLDPVAVEVLSRVLVGEARRGATVLFSSHHLDLVEHVCERAVVVDRGRVVAQGTIDDLTAGAHPVLDVDVPSDQDGSWATRLPGVEVVRAGGGRVRLALAGENGSSAERAQTVLDAARRAGPVSHFAFDRRSLAEVFLTTVGRPVDPPQAEETAMADSTGLVARREVREAIRTTSYKVTLALSAVVLAVIVVIANLGDDAQDPERVVVAGAGAGEAAAISELGAAVGVPVEVQQVSDDATAHAAVADGDADLAISADGRTLTTKEELDLSGDSSLATLVNVLRADLALRQGLEAAGLDPEESAAVRAAAPPALDTIDRAPADEVDPGRVTTALVTNIFLFLMIQTYGGWVLTAVTREKASRVVEVLLSVITPRQLLVGKLVGVGVVALLHATVLAAVASVTTRVMGADITDGIRVGDLAIFLAWFVLGYALYCGAFAAAGSLVSRMEDAETVAFPLMLPLLFGYIVSFSAVDGANTLVWILAFIPLTAVVAMPTLYALGEAPLWAVGLSMVITALGVVVMAMAAARIYERSVLQSRKLSWRQAFRSPREIGEEGAGPPDGGHEQHAVAASVDS